MKILRPLFLLLTATASLGNDNFATALAKFDQLDQTTTPEKNALLFVGSSSIRLWDLEKSFPGKNTLNRGFGGSQLHHTAENLDLLVLRHKPTIVFLYAGDNDISSGKSVEQTVADFQEIAHGIHAALPQTHLVFLPIKPSLSRWELWPKMEQANQKIRTITEQNPHLHFLPTHHALLGPDNQPLPAFFQPDGLHLSKKGYAAWNKIVLAWLEKNHQPS